MSAITIRLDFPPKELAPNFRTTKPGWVRAIKTKYRDDCRLLTLNARDCKTVYPLTGPLEGSAVFYVTRGRGPDTDNALASLKACIDGIADAGVIANDRDIVVWSVRVEKGVKRCVDVVIRERGL